MRAAGMILGVSVMVGSGCLSLGVTDPSTGGAGGMDTSSVGSGMSGAGGACVLDAPCDTGKTGVCANGFLSCEKPQTCIQTQQPSAEKCESSADENCDGSGDCSGKAAFSAGYGNQGVQIAHDVAVDSQGNVVVAGVFEGNVDFGGGIFTSAGSTDIFVVKFDSQGAHVWSKQFGDNSGQVASAIAVDAYDNVYIGGLIDGTVTFGSDTLPASNADAFIAKLDAEGNPLWAKYAQAPGRQGFEDIAVDSSGNVIAVGYAQAEINFGNGNVGSGGEDDILIAKFGAKGENLWTKSFGDPAGYEWATAVATDTRGDILVTGWTTSALDIVGKPLPFGGGIDAYLAKLDAQGNPLWAQGFGVGNVQEGVDVATDKDNNVILTLKFEAAITIGPVNYTVGTGITDAAIAKFDSNGQHLWSKQLKATNDNTGVFVNTDNAGNVLATCAFQGMIDFGVKPLASVGTDMAFAKFSPAGNLIYSYGYGSAGSQIVPLAVAAGQLGHAWVVGSFVGTVDFGPGALTSGTSDMLLVKFSP